MGNVVRHILDHLRPVLYQTPSDWVESCLDLRHDQSASHDGLVNLAWTPYMREPLDAWADDDVRQITVQAPEQTGKSATWKWGLLWALVHDPGPSLIVYENEDKAADINRDSFEPLMVALPSLAVQLARPYAKRRDCYRLLDAPIYFQGAGAPITSKPVRYAIADEPDFWQLPNEANKSARVSGVNVSNLKNLRKRTRTYGDSKIVVVCSPTTKGGAIDTARRQGSCGWWCLRCLGCGTLTRSALTRPLQWQYDDDERIVEESIRWCCPECGRAHVEGEAHELTTGGEYEHERPGERRHRSYQWGLLAVPAKHIGWSTTWMEIAKATRAGGPRGNREDQVYLDNSVRGIAYSRRKETDGKRDTLKRLEKPLVDPEAIAVLLMAADTQDNGFYWTVRALDVDENLWPIGHGFASDFGELGEVWDREWLELAKCELALIDEGGHRADEVQRWVANRAGFYTYKGWASPRTPWKISSESADRILANARTYQARLLDLILRRECHGTRDWYLPENPDQPYIDHLLALRPPKSGGRRNADSEYEDWTNEQRADHWFDCEKEMLVLADFAMAELAERNWIQPLRRREKTPADQAKQRVMRRRKAQRRRRN